MRKFFQAGYIPVLLFMLMLAVSCSDDKDDSKSEATTTDAASETEKPELQLAPLIGGTLDTLWIASASFPNNPEKIVFSFSIDANDNLKLHGWKVKAGPNQFDDAPNYILTNAGQHKGGTYGADMYFDNIILQQNDVAKIRTAINQGNYTKVLFVPKKIGVNLAHLAYDIFLGKDGPQPLDVLVVDPTGLEANPSPPKNY